MATKDREQKDSGIVPLTFEPTGGMNTAPQRAGVRDEFASWMDGFIPLAERRYRTLPDVGSALFSGPLNNIVFFQSFNLGAHPYLAVANVDGSVLARQIDIPGTFTVIPAGGVSPAPSITTFGMTQYGEQYLLMVAQKQSSGNGYWAWDGVNTYQAGTLQPNVALTDSGIGYSVAPTVSASGGHGSGSSFSASIAGGAVVNISVINPGNGYSIGDSPSLVFTGGLVNPSGATVSIVSMGVSVGGSGGTITPFWNEVANTLNYTPTLSLVAAGSGYTSLVTATFNAPPSGSSWISSGVPNITLTQSGGVITGAFLQAAANNPSELYNPTSIVFANAATVAPAGSSIFPITAGASMTAGLLVFDKTLPGVVPLGTSLVVGTTGAGTITISNVLFSPGIGNGDNLTFVPPGAFASISVADPGFFFVNSVSLVSGGSNYNANTSILISGGAPFKNATITPILSGAALASLTGANIVDGGEYFSNAHPTLTVSDSSRGAAGTISIWPFGVLGNAVQTYNGMVWVFNGNAFQFTAPGAVANFATSAGGGSRQSNASYLKIGYTGAVAANGFLFLIGDSSMDYISGVVTSGSIATTTFTQNNSDPEIGTPYPQTLSTWGTEIMVANQIGVFLSSGGEFRKISEQLDGVYQSVPVGSVQNFYNNPFSGAQLSVAKFNVFGKRCWAVLVPIIDPITGSQVNKLLIVRDKKIWFASNQSVGLNFINTYDFNGIIAALGTDGTQIYPLFATMGGGFTKTLQSKLWDDPGGIEYNKAPSRFWSTWFANSSVSTSISLTIDSVGLSAAGQFTSQSSYSIAGPTSVGYFVTPPQAVGQQGVFVGMTLRTNAADVEMVTAKIAEEVVGEMT